MMQTFYWTGALATAFFLAKQLGRDRGSIMVILFWPVTLVFLAYARIKTGVFNIPLSKNPHVFDLEIALCTLVTGLLLFLLGFMSA